MIFCNRPPIALEAAKELADAQRDGGHYDGIGYDSYTVYQGKKLHLVHSYSTGCEYNHKVDRSCTHLGAFADLDALVAFLIAQATPDNGMPWWASKLLEKLGVPGEEA